MAGYRQIVCTQIYIERDEKRPRADDDCAGRRVQPTLADIGRAVRIGFDYPAQPFKTLAANMLEPHAVRTQRGAFVKINGNRKLLPDSFSGFTRQSYAVIHGHAADGHER